MVSQINSIVKDFTNCHCTPINSIRAFCIQCVGYQKAEVRACETRQCPLLPYRMGGRPKDSVLLPLSRGLALTRRKEAGS